MEIWHDFCFYNDDIILHLTVDYQCKKRVPPTEGLEKLLVRRLPFPGEASGRPLQHVRFPMADSLLSVEVVFHAAGLFDFFNRVHASGTWVPWCLWLTDLTLGQNRRPVWLDYNPFTQNLKVVMTEQPYILQLILWDRTNCWKRFRKWLFTRDPSPYQIDCIPLALRTNWN